MNIFSKTLSKLGIKNKANSRNIELNQLYKFLGIDANAGSNNLSEATYFSCLKVLSESIGKLPLKILQHNENKGVSTLRDHHLYTLLHDRPNPYMTASIFWSTVEYNRNHYGNAYVWIQGVGTEQKLWILPSTDVKVWLVQGIKYNWTLLKIYTDEGYTGVGEATNWPGSPIVFEAAKHVGQRIIGLDPMKTDFIWTKLYRDLNWIPRATRRSGCGRPRIADPVQAR